MKSEKRYFIYVYNQMGNVGKHYFDIIADQPKEGFLTEEAAEEHLLFLIKEGQTHWFQRDWYKFVIMKTFILNKII